MVIREKNCRIVFPIIAAYLIYLMLGCESTVKESDLRALQRQEMLFYYKLVDLRGAPNFSMSQIADQMKHLQTHRNKIPVMVRDSILEDEIKLIMQNPKSFEHIETQYKPDTDYFYAHYGYLIATVKFFGTNIYGGTVRQAIKARITPHGFILATLEADN